MNFYQTIQAAIRDIVKHGYDHQWRIDFWIQEIRKAALQSLTPTHVLENAVRQILIKAYSKYVEKGGILKFHPGVSLFTVQQVKPKLHAELQRRIMTNANLIVLNREASIQRTVQRFVGWASSIPDGGTQAADKLEVADHLKKAMAQLPFEERRVIIDQGHKFIASLNEIIANDGGAIAGKWSSRWKEPGYDYREDHKERDGKYYAIKGSWAQKAGLINQGSGYTCDMTAPGEEVYCRCSMVYYTNLRDLPDDMLTEKGHAELERVKEEIKKMKV